MKSWTVLIGVLVLSGCVTAPHGSAVARYVGSVDGLEVEILDLVQYGRKGICVSIGPATVLMPYCRGSRISMIDSNSDGAWDVFVEPSYDGKTFERDVACMPDNAELRRLKVLFDKAFKEVHNKEHKVVEDLAKHVES